VIGDGRGRVGFIAWVEAAEKGGGEAPFTAADLRCERAPVRLIFFLFGSENARASLFAGFPILSVRWLNMLRCA
jgi:hypothetical protein